MAGAHSQTKVTSSTRTTVIDIPEYLEANPVKRLTEKQKLSANVIDFLRGIVTGEWDLSRSRWSGKTLPTTGTVMTKVQVGTIRDELMRLGWADWRYSSGKNNGWYLASSAKDILEKIVPK